MQCDAIRRDAMRCNDINGVSHTFFRYLIRLIYIYNDVQVNFMNVLEM